MRRCRVGPCPVGANQNSGAAIYSYVYDRFGNRWQQNGPIFDSHQFTGNGTNNKNRIDGYSYDTAGNVIGDGTLTYTYDAENRLISVTGASTNSTYVYDALGRRVKKTGNSVECGYAGIVYYLYDLSDRADVFVPSGGTNNCHDEVYAGGRHLATYAGGLTFSQTDWLGTERLRHTYGYSTSETCSSLPFGDNLVRSSSEPSYYRSPLHFTGKERDFESGLDNFGARYNSPSMGRFMSPDPAGMFAVRLAYPQTLNRYSYVLNNPLSLADPLGLDCAYLNDAGNGVESVDQNSSAGECGQTGGYWVTGTLTQAYIDPDATTVSLQGTTNWTDVTSASYQQDTTLDVGWYQNTFANPFGHIALGIGNNTPVGLNPRSDSDFFLHALGDFSASCVANGNCYNALYDAFSRATVPGAILPQTGTAATQNVVIPITGMQATLIQTAINQSTQSSAPYSIFGPSPACDCGTWAQRMMSAGGVQSGGPAPIPQDLMNQLSQTYGGR